MNARLKSLAASFFCLSSLQAHVLACSRAAPMPSPQSLINQSEAIVLAKLPSGLPATEVGQRAIQTFDCEKVIKGSPCDESSRIRLPAVVVDKDELMDNRDTPIRSARKSADAECGTYHYRSGAYYLLLLKKRQEPGWGPYTPYTPYWEALAPTNEQVTGPSDPWVLWVETNVRGLIVHESQH